MSTVFVENSTVKRLASTMQDDIRCRGLRPGDRYLTASEAGRKFNASEMSVHRAMQLLAEGDYLVRLRGAGTFVGSKFKGASEQWCALQVVHVVMAMDCQRIATLPAELLVEHLGVAMPEAVVQVHYVPDYDSLRHLDRIVSAIEQGDKSREGVILVRSSRAMQLFMEKAAVPVVVFGSVYSDVSKLSSIDLDQEAVGRLIARHAVNAGHKRLALLMRDDWRQGDNRMFSGVTQELSSHGLGFDALTVQCIPPERDHIVQEVRRIMSLRDAPTVLMVRNHLYADAAEEALRSLKLRRSTLLVSGGGRKPLSAGYPYVAPEIDEEEQIQLLGRMLLDQVTQEKPRVQNRVVPVKICVP